MNSNPYPPCPYSNPRVQEQTNKLARLSLFAKMVEPPLDRELAINTIKSDIKGLTDLEQLPNDWILLKFSTTEDKESFEYTNGPYFVQGQLLALYPWSESFNPFKEEPKMVDLWARIPLLPLSLFHEEALFIILRDNNVGKMMDMDYSSNADNKMRFARVLIKVDLSRPLVRMISFTNEVGSTVHLRVWYEGYSPGCECCGEEDHVVGDCPLVCVQPRKFHVVLEDGNSTHEDLIQESRRVILLGGVEAEYDDGPQPSQDSEASTRNKVKMEDN